MSGWSVLLFGFGLGIRHATDADHVAVIATLLQREPGVWRAVRLAALWGVGHTLAFLSIGMLIVLANVEVPPMFERAADVVVAAMLVGIGAAHLWGARTAKPTQRQVPRASSARPVAIGIVHGLAGSAAIGLMTASTIASRAVAVAYLSLFGIGTILGMMMLTVLIARPISWSMRREGRLKDGVTVGAALLSITLGVALLVENST